MKHTYIAMRRDGLGERLRALLNAMMLAKITDSHFAFSWPNMNPVAEPDHAILPVEETFDDSFVKNFHISPKSLKERNVVLLSEIERMLNNDSMLQQRLDFVSVGQIDLGRQAPSLVSNIDISSVARSLFDSIPFSSRLEAARGFASAVELPDNIVALHLRAGDIIYGQYRFMDRYHGKVCPYPIALSIAKEVREASKTLLVFAQDGELASLFKRDFDALLASELSSGMNFSRAQQALFEICLMGRCDDIVAAASGFAQASALISGRSLRDPRKYYSPEKSIEIIESAVLLSDLPKEVSNLQRSFACRSAFIFGGYQLPPNARFRELLELARSLDPDNGFLDLVHACDLYTNGSHTIAEEIIAYLLVQGLGTLSPIQRVLTKASPDGSLPVDPYVAILNEQTMRGRPVATLCMALIHKARKETKLAQKYAELFFARASDDLAPLGHALLRPSTP